MGTSPRIVAAFEWFEFQVHASDSLEVALEVPPSLVPPSLPPPRGERQAHRAAAKTTQVRGALGDGPGLHARRIPGVVGGYRPVSLGPGFATDSPADNPSGRNGTDDLDGDPGPVCSGMAEKPSFGKTRVGTGPRTHPPGHDDIRHQRNNQLGSDGPPPRRWYPPGI